MQCLAIVVSGCGTVVVEMILHLIPWHVRENGGLRNEHMPVVSERRASDGPKLVDAWLW